MAMSCLAMHDDTDDVYTLSLINYAYSLYGVDTTDRRNVLDRLRAKAINEGQACALYFIVQVT